MKLSIAVIALLITIQQQEVALSQAIIKYYVSNNTSVYLNWSTIQHNISRYFTSHTVMCFLSGEYNLDKQLTITNIMNFTIMGRSTVVFKCRNGAGMFIRNSISVIIQNVAFINCGISDTLNTTAAINLYNVRSMKLCDIVFENSIGPGIAGLGKSLFNNITIYHKNHYSKSNLSHSRHLMGGIILRFVDATDGMQTNLKNIVTIKSCTIHSMSDYDGPNMSSTPQYILGLFFRQKTYTANVEIVNMVMAKLVSHNTSIIWITHNSSIPNSVSISNSNFMNVKSKRYSIIFIVMLAKQLVNCKLTISNCNILYNIAMILRTLRLSFKHLELKMTSTTVAHNKEGENPLQLSSFYVTGPVIIDRCDFKSNDEFRIEVINDQSFNVVLRDNLFCNNSLQTSNGLLSCSKPVFEGSNNFSLNKANIIISVQKYIYIREGATLNISCNRALHVNRLPRSLVNFTSSLATFPCLFQFLSPKFNSDEDVINNNSINFSVIFSNNHNYTSAVYGTILNSCYWLPHTTFKHASPGDVNRKVIKWDTTKYIIARNEPTFCYCDKSTDKIDCLRDHFLSTPIYPGQMIPISLIQIPTYQITTIYPRKDFWSYGFLLKYNPFPPCHLVSIQPSNYWFQVVYKQCVPLFFRVYTDSLEPCSAFFNAMGYTSTRYHFKIGFRKCPLGFENYNGSCQCNKHLKAEFPTLTCDIETQTLNHSGKSWIGSSYDRKRILYVKRCVRIFCANRWISMMLDKSDMQCVGNRVGVKCGQCPSGLDGALGTFNCKECTNYMLWLTPVFFIAGILLVFCLFTLNVTVVDGKINGFILYANVAVVSGYYAFPSHGILFILLSLSNLDLGIETCFYRGMTEYDKTWLQFVFSLYLLCIVGVLAITSRYSSYVERLTRKRVIPVIATIFLLSYSKILLVTAKVLFSYATLHTIDGNHIETRLIWLWDSSIPLFGKHFIPLFVVSLVVLLTVLLPLNLCLLFTKVSYRIKFVSNHLKPFLDAYQAPFKLKHYYYFGIELLIRPVLFAFGNGILAPHKTMAVYSFICGILLIYLCVFKPFKSSATSILYTSFVLNLSCKILLYLYFDNKTTSTSYVILFNTLVVIALTEFGCTVLYHFYASQLYKYRHVAISLAKIARSLDNFQERFLGKTKKSVPIMMQTASCEHLREELLTADLEL